MMYDNMLVQNHSEKATGCQLVEEAIKSARNCSIV